jgi:hypothetical protein
MYLADPVKRVVRHHRWAFSAIDAPASRFATLEKFHEEVVRPTNHHVPKARFISNGISEPKAMVLHSRDQRFKVIGLNSEMMDSASSRRFRRLIIDLKKGMSKRQSHISHTSCVFVPNDLGAKHCTEELDGRRDVGREDVCVIEADAHGG